MVFASPLLRQSTDPLGVGQICNRLLLHAKGGLATYSTGDLLLGNSVYKGYSVKEFVDNKGSFYLFRAIGGNYTINQTGFFSNIEGAISYTLDPYIANAWGFSGFVRRDKNNSFILISKHNIHNSDHLTYGISLSQKPFRQCYDAGVGKSLLNPFGHLAQVNVPFGDEKILVEVPLKTFNQILGNFSKQNRSISDLVEYFLRN